MKPRQLQTGDPLSHPTAVSFRDPAGRVIVLDQRVFRIINNEYRPGALEFLQSKLCSELVDSGRLIATYEVEDSRITDQLDQFVTSQSGPVMVLEHEHVAFPSYPYEWPPEMLKAAGELTLDLMDRLLPEGFGLKDASPYNVLYQASRPVFVDFLSIEKRAPLDPTWLAYAQFVRTFIRPLLANKHFGLGLDQTFRIYRDGLQPEHVFRMASALQKVRPVFLTSVSIPTILSRMDPARYKSIYVPKQSNSAEQAQFILKRQVGGLRRKLESSKPTRVRESIWLDYESRESEREEYLPSKEKFVRNAVREVGAQRVLDVGCNLGFFSILAAKEGASVVAIDQDAVVVGRLWEKANRDNLNILPLVIDLTRPTSGLGWRNLETRGFLERAIGAFDCVLMLAVIHHMLVTERIPLSEILKLAWELTTNQLVIEWVAADDPLFHLITRGNDHLYEYLTREFFEAVSLKYFQIERVEQMGNQQRWLYQMRRRDQVVQAG